LGQATEEIAGGHPAVLEPGSMLLDIFVDGRRDRLLGAMAAMV
jgi:hypothetical protein